MTGLDLVLFICLVARRPFISSVKGGKQRAREQIHNSARTLHLIKRDAWGRGRVFIIKMLNAHHCLKSNENEVHYIIQFNKATFGPGWESSYIVRV